MEKAIDSFSSVIPDIIDNLGLTLPKSYVRNAARVLLKKDFDKINSTLLNLNEQIITPFTWQEFKSALKSKCRSGAHGPDLISSAIIDKFPDEVLTFLLKLYNKIFNCYDYPAEWLSFFMVFIPKPNSSSVRPISLANNLFKVFESLIYHRLTWWAEHSKFIASLQFGFRKSRSTTDNLVILTSDIRQGFFAKELTGVLFIDVKGAFDNVRPNIMVDILTQIGLPVKFIKFLEFLLTERKVEGFVDGSSLGSRTARIGLPQGSVLSPLLYNLYTSFIFYALPANVKYLAYADDVVLYSSSRFCGDIFQSLQLGLDLLNCELEQLGLTLSAEKTKFCLFSQDKFRKWDNFIRRNHLSLNLKGQRITMENTIKFLGLTLDRGLSFKPHCIAIKHTLQRRISVLKSMAGIDWGAHPHNLLTVYKGWIRSVLDYGSQAFGDISPSVAIILDKLQFKALRVVLGLMPSTPTNALLHLCGESPLYLRRELIFKKYLLKCFSIKPHPIRRLMLSLRDRDLDKVSCISISPFSDMYAFFLETSSSLYSTELPPQVNGDFLLGLHQPVINSEIGFMTVNPIISLDEAVTTNPTDPPSFHARFQKILFSCGFGGRIIIFTDGSRIPDLGVGCSIYSGPIGISLKYKLSDLNTIFEAEAFAISHALRIIEDQDSDKGFTIGSDSLSVLTALGNHNLKKAHHPLIFLIKDLLCLLHELGFDINFVWTPGHKGIYGNERADILARDAARNSNPDQHSEVVFSQSYSRILTNESWQKSILFFQETALQRGFRYFNRTKTKNLGLWCQKMPYLSRNIIVLISRLRSHHVRVASHLHGKNIIDSPLCECGEVETLDHFLFKCILHKKDSDQLSLSLFKSFDSWPPVAEELAFSDDVTVYLEIAKFIKKIGKTL